jgi:hypothetical protein
MIKGATTWTSNSLRRLAAALLSLGDRIGDSGAVAGLLREPVTDGSHMQDPV